MKKMQKFIFIISLVFVQLSVAQVFKRENPKDSVVYKQRYGLRIGGDVSKLIRPFLDKNYYGLELVGDYRINFKYYIAGELGWERKSTTEDHFSYKTDGQFIRLGLDYNTYGNWYGMENMIYVGGRYAFALFGQDLTSYSIHKDNQYWSENLNGVDSQWIRNFEGRTAHWLELLFGIKVELLRNLYAGASLRLGFMIINSYDSFPNYWIPGFARVREDSRFGASYNYTITYLIPLYKKAKNKSK